MILVSGLLALALPASFGATALAAPMPTTVFAGTPGTDTELGYSVALSGNGQAALVGDPQANGGAGVAYLYVASAGTWPGMPTATFTGAPGSSDQMGWSVALSADGQTALVGAEGANGTGAAFLYTASSDWSDTPVATFTPGDTPYGGFGHAVALSGDGQTALVGAYTGTGNYAGSGAAFLFTAASGWSDTPTAFFTQGPSQLFGESVALSDDGQSALVGQPYASAGSASPGAALLYTASSGWSNTPAVAFTADVPEGEFGWSVALSQNGQVALVGAPADRVSPCCTSTPRRGGRRPRPRLTTRARAFRPPSRRTAGPT